MKVTNLEIEGLKLIELQKFSDNRGYFVERFNTLKYPDLGLPAQFAQDNHSYSVPKVLRGMHIQYKPAQSKLVGVTRGKIWDVVVDLRRNSPTYLKNFSVELSADNGLLLWIPAGFAHGFCILGNEPADVFYKVDVPYNPQGEVGLLWNDPDLNIPWPIKDPILSERDKKLISFKEYQQKYENNS